MCNKRNAGRTRNTVAGLRVAVFLFSSVAFTGNVWPAPSPSVAGSAAMENARAYLLKEDFNAAILEYAQLANADTSDAVLNSEFAYALALGGVYDAALYRLDRIRANETGNSGTAFYSAEVMALMGFEELASELRANQVKGNTPAWISSKAPELLGKYRRPEIKPDAGEDISSMFRQANIFAARNSVLQAMALFEEITTLYPGEYLPYLGYSIALEKAGLYRRAEQVLQEALALVGQDAGQADAPSPAGQNAGQADAREVIEKRLATIQGLIAGTGQEIQPATPETFNPKLMAYGGGYVASSFISINAKAGVFLSAENYATLEGGMTQSGSNVFGTLGMSFYNRHGIYVVGAGLTSSIGSSTIFYGKISVGLSFMNKKGTSSFDIFLDGKLPLKKGYSTMMGLSIGQSFYFGNRK